MDQRERLSDKERLLVAMAAAMGAGCRTCARGLWAKADEAGVSADEIELAFRDGLLQRERATELMRAGAGALLGRELRTGGTTRPEVPTHITALGRLAASVAANAAPDALKSADAARASGATEAELRVAIGIGRSVRARAESFSDGEIDESHAEGPESAEVGVDCCAQGAAPCSC